MNTTNQGTQKSIMTIFSTRQMRAYSLLFFLVIMWGLWLPTNPSQTLAQAPTTQNGLLGEYFNNYDLTSYSFMQIDSMIDMPNTISPSYTTSWSARWIGYVVPDFNEDYTFCLDIDEGARLYIDETLIIDEWLYPDDTTEYGLRTVCAAPISLSSVNGHSIRLEYYEIQNNGAELRLRWQSASTPQSLVPTTALFVPEVNYNPTDEESLQYALRVANPSICPATATTIILPANSEYVVTPSLQFPGIRCSIIIEGNNSVLTGARFITNISSTSLTLRDLTITGSSARSGGAMYLSQGHTVIENVQFIGNTAYGYYKSTAYGGAIFVDGAATLTVRNSLFAYNSSITNGYTGYAGYSAQGGAIGSRGQLIIEDTNFYGNYAENNGGAIYTLNSANVELYRVNIQSNIAGYSGGAIVTGNLYAESSCFIDNDDSTDLNLSLSTTTNSIINSYWGSSDGPSGAYPGSGDSVGSLQADVTGILTSAPSYCDDPVTNFDVGDGAQQALRNVFDYTMRTSACELTPITINLTNNGTYNLNTDFPYNANSVTFPVHCPIIINGNNSTLEINENRDSARLFEVEGRQNLGEGSLSLYDLNIINTSSYVNSNSTPYTAGLINSFEGDVWIENSSFSPAPLGQDGAYGGAIQVTQANFDFINSEIRNSQLVGAGSHGSAIALLDASARITGSLITTNISDEAEAIYTNSSLTITDTDINFNASNGLSDALLVELTDVADSVSIQNSCISGQPNIAINSIGLGTIDATNNWWGASDGSSNAGGAGDTVAGNIDYSNHLVTKPLFCNDNTIVTPAPITIANGDTTALITAIETLNSTTCGLAPQVINLHPDGYYEFDSVMGNEYYTNSALVVTCPLTINGNGATLAPSPTVARMRWMSATAPMSGYQAFGYNFLALNDIILENWGYDEDNINLDYIDGHGYGSGLYLRRGNVVVNNSILRNNIGDQGGVFYLDSASMEVNDSLFENNAGDYQGGAIYLYNLYNLSSLVINNSDFNNHETYDGGGVILSHADYNIGTPNEILIDSSRFNANHSYSDGGVIYAENTNVTITGVSSPTIFTNNHSYYGGAIYVYGNLSVSDTIFDGNNSGGNGGAIVVDGGFILSNVEARNNFADGIGGFAYPDGGWELDHVFLIEDSLIENNIATGEGGAIYARWDDYTLEPVASIINTEFINNHSDDNGGALYFSEGVFAIEDSTITGNTSQASGGAIYSERSRFDIQNTNIRYNSAEINGGAIYVVNDNGDATSNAISNNTVIIGNRAGDSGGAVYSTQQSNDAPIDIINTIIINNFALNEGDALYVENSDDASSINNSCIVNNGAVSVYTTGLLAVDAIDNWWGDVAGPIGTSVIGADNVSGDINYTPFLTAANLGCDSFLDTDGDLLIDEYELILGTDPNQTDTDADGNNDGLEVLVLATDPLIGIDTDGDGLNDDAEITGSLNINYGNAPTLPDDADTDADGLNDGDEVFTYLTDPNSVDTDGDILSDGDEVSGILNTGYNSEATSPILADSDGDGLNDDEEIALGTNPNDADTDGDGLTDGDEVNSYQSDPLETDTDADTLSDGDEVSGILNTGYNNEATSPILSDTDGDGLDDDDEITLGTNPNDADTDGDTLSDGDEISGILNTAYNSEATSPILADSDGDGLNDGDEIALGANPNDADTDADTLSDGDEFSGILNIGYNSEATSPILADSDGDGLSDSEEITLGTNPNDADTDADTLNDGDEISGILNIGYNSEATSPILSDSDGDGLNDGDEIALGTNPNDGDTDGDSILDDLDNCALVGNTDQADHDSDGEGDSCEFGPIDRFNTTIFVDKVAANADGTDTITLSITVRATDNNVMNNVPVNITASRLDGTDTNSFIELSNFTGLTDINGEFQTTITNTRAELIQLSIEIGTDGDLIYGYEIFQSALLEFIGPDMSISVISLPRIIAGQTLIYAIDVENLGGIEATNVNLFAGIPLGTGIIESVITPFGIEIDQIGINSVSWLIPSALPASSYQILVYARSASNLQMLAQVPFEAGVEASSDSNLANNNASANTLINIAVAPEGTTQSDKLDVQYYASTTTGVIGETVTLIIDVTNNTVDEALYNIEGFAALKDTFANYFEAASILQFDWSDPANAGTLLPGETVTATFDYIVTDRYMNLSGAIRTVRISADDANPADGQSYVSQYNGLSYTELGSFGPGPQIQLLADKTSVAPGDTVNFTVRILNRGTFNDSISNLIITELLTGQTLSLSSIDPIEPGETVTTSFSYVVQESDTPRLSVIVTAEGNGTLSNAIVSESIQTTINVNSIINSAVNLSLSDANAQVLVFSNVPFNLPISVINSGTLAAADTELRVTLPLHINVLDAGTAVYNVASRTLTWNLGSLSAGGTQSVIPQLQTSGNIGDDISLNFSVSNTFGDSDYSDNALTVMIPIVAPAPSNASLIPVDRNWLVGDGVDSIDYIVTLTDQLGNAYPNVSGLAVSNAGTLSLSPSSFVTDVNGQALITISSELPGTDVLYVDFGAGVTSSTSIQIRPNSLTLNPLETRFGVGGYGLINVSLTNTYEEGESFTFEVTGLEALDASNLSFSPESLLLNTGQTGISRLQIGVPFTTTACTALPGVYPITIEAYDSQLNLVDSASETITIEATAPSVSRISPADAGRVGNNVSFSWRSNTAGTATIYVKPVGGVETEYTLTPNANDSSYYGVNVSLPGTGFYEWRGEFDNGCDTLVIPLRTFETLDEVVFVDRDYSYIINDDYDLREDVNGEPLRILIRNDSSETRRASVSLDNPYEDLIIGLTGPGSLDSYLTLLPGQVANLDLRVFTQETLQSDYTITLNLSSPDTDAIDSVPLTIVIQPSDVSFDVSIVDAVIDTRNLVTEAVLVNNGATLTDLDIQVIDLDTGLPANFVILPDIDHAYMPVGSSFPIEIIPRSIMDDITQGNYAIRASSRLGVISQVPITAIDQSDYDLTQVCTAERPIAQTCTATSGSITLESGSWYCTNRPNIDITIPWTLNSEVPITSVSAGMTFTNRGTVYSHSTELFFNNVSIGGGIVPDTPRFDFDVSQSSIIDGANYQTLNLRSLHTNEAHYSVASNAFITVNYGQYERTACYSEDELLDAEIFPCGDQSECQADITASQASIERGGDDNVAVTVRIGNGGTVFVTDDVAVSFYNGNPVNGGNLLLTTSISQALNPGDYEDIVVSLPIASTTALPLYVVADDAGGLSGSYPESNEQNNIYNTGISLSPDIYVNTVDMSAVTIDPNTGIMSGVLSAQINSAIAVRDSFDIVFFEDTNGDGIYDTSDNTLATTTQTGLVQGIPAFVSASVSDVIAFSNSPIYVYADSNDVIIETDELNNVGSSITCLFSEGCETALPDLTASYLRRSANGSMVDLIVRIGNGGGNAVPAGVSVAFYDSDPADTNSVVLQTVITTQGLDVGDYEDVSVSIPLTSDAMPVWVVADNTNSYDETDELNNVYRSNVYVTDDPNTAPIVDAGADIVIVEGQELIDGRYALDASVSDDGLPVGLISVVWDVVGGDNDRVSFSSIDSIDTVVSFTEAGIYILSLTASDGDLSTTDDIEITYEVPPPPPLPNHTLDINGCIAMPTHADQVRGLVDIVVDGNTSLTNASVFYWAANDPQAYVTLAEGLEVTANSSVAIFDTTILANDTYGVQLVGYDSTTLEEIVCGVGLSVTGEYKPGRVVLSTTDFTIPLAGLPITVGRTYDSLERNVQSDFGYGWALALGNPRLEIDDANNITMTLPSGQRKTFYWDPTPFAFVSTFSSPNYVSEVGEYGSVSTNGCALLAGDVCFPGNYYSLSVTTVSYEDPYGREFTYGIDGRLHSILDLNGNLLSFELDGIYSNADPANPKLVSFVRDAEGRITEIRDNANQVYRYSYDANGDLVSVILPSTATVTDPTISYGYYTEAEGLAHFFQSGTDPRGNAVIATTYDADGRLASVTDGLNNQTQYSYDVLGRTTTVTNPDSTTMVMGYDEWGNLTSEMDELGRTTSYSYYPDNNLESVTNNDNETTSYIYDAQGNRTSVTNGLGIEVISASYNQYGAPQTLEDANGVSRNIAYDGSTGMPLSASDPLGPIGSYTWNPQGSPTAVTDAAGKTTTYSYDAYGNVTSQTAPATDDGSNVMTYTYDAMGRRETATDLNGTVSETTYDPLGNVLAVTTTNGGSTLSSMSYEYDANGNRTAVIDAENNRTDYLYDNNNRVVQVTAADGTYSTTDYDWRGNVTAQASYTYGNILLNKTCYSYDAAGQLTDVIANCGMIASITTHYVYDNAGRRVETYEAWTGNPLTSVRSSLVVYDDAGRVISTTDAAGISTNYGYDSAGQLLTVTDALNRVTRYEYDVRGRRTRTIYPDGTFSVTQYDEVGRVTRQIDALGYQTAFNYDEAGNLLEQTRAFGTTVNQSTSYDYDILGRRISMSDARGGVSQYNYDELGRVSSMCDASAPLGNCTGQYITASYVYDLRGQQTSVTDANSNTTTYSYDELGRPETITYADNSVETITYNARGQRVSTSYGGYGTQYLYNEIGQMTGICYTVNDVCQQISARYSYDARGRQITTTIFDIVTTDINDANVVGVTSRMVYDDANRLTMQIANFNGGGLQDPSTWSFNGTNWTDGSITISHGVNADSNIISQYTFDALGRRSTVRDVNGNLTSYTYQALTNRLASMSNPDGTSVSYNYNALGQRTRLTDENGNATNYAYDALGRLTAVQNAEGETVSYGYDANNNVTRITNGRNNSIHFAYDELNRLLGKCDAEGGYNCATANYTTAYSYDANGNMTQEVLADGTINTFNYDALNRLSYEVYDFNTANEYTFGYDYDSRGLLENVYSVAPNIATTNDILSTYTYDVLGRPTAVSHDDGQSIHYGYDALGNRTSLETQISGVTQTDVDYSYDALNRVQTVTDTIGANPAITEFDYSLIGQMTSISRPNGITTHYSYDPQRYFVDEIEHLDGINLLSRYDYSYDNVGNRTSMDITAQDSSVTAVDYAYDDAYRLTSESYVLAGNALSTTSYQYDRAGNRTQMSNSDGITSYTYNKDDELTDVNLPDFYYEDYEYDARGNLIEVKFSGHGSASFQHYGYNAQDHMTSYGTSADGSAISNVANYDYNHVGNRVAQTIASSTTSYLWDEFSRYDDVILETNSTNTIGYTLANGMLIAQTNNGNIDYFLQDAQNTTVGITDSGGTLTSSYTYDAFGNLDDGIDPLSLETNYLYTGQQFDGLYTELYNLRARQYDPSNGRFTSRDTWAYNYGNPVELNRYAYSQNNPATYSDPSGNTSLITYAQRVASSTVVSAGLRGVVGGISNVLMEYLFAWIFQTEAQPLIAFGEGFVGGAAGYYAGNYAKAGKVLKKFLELLVEFGAGVGFDVGARGENLGTSILFNLGAGAIGLGLEQLGRKAAPRIVAAFPWLGRYFGIDPNSPSAPTGPTTPDSPNGSGLSDSPNNTPDVGDTGGNGVNGDGHNGTTDPGDGGNGNRNNGDGGSANICGVLNSFSADTTVETPDGDVPISEVEIGDTVIAYDEETGITGEYAVTDTISHEDDQIAYVTINGEEIETTPWHLFYTSEGWVEAGELEVGDAIVSLGGVYGTVDSVIVVDATQTMYDLTVEEVHTFAVGDGDWVVHNCQVENGDKSKFDTATENETRVSGGASPWENFRAARDLAIAYTGDDLTQPFLGEFEHNRGLVLGLQSADTSRGWRVDWDPIDANKGLHINWWDRTGGSKRRDWLYGAIVIENGTQDIYFEIINRLNSMR